MNWPEAFLVLGLLIVGTLLGVALGFALSRESEGKEESDEHAHPYDPAEVRAWARAHGYTVGTRGRLSLEVVRAYTVSQQ